MGSVVVVYNAADIFDVYISVITVPLTYLQKQSTEATLPIKECSQRKCVPCGCDGEWRVMTLVRCRSASAHRHVEGETSQGRIHTCPHSLCANRAKSRWAPSPSNGLPAINNPSFRHTADQIKFSALIHVPLCAFRTYAAAYLCAKFVQRSGSRSHTKEFFSTQSNRARLSVMVLWCLNRTLIVILRWPWGHYMELDGLLMWAALIKWDSLGSNTVFQTQSVWQRVMCSAEMCRMKSLISPVHFLKLLSSLIYVLVADVFLRLFWRADSSSHGSLIIYLWRNLSAPK